MAELPATLLELRAAISGRRISVAEALAAQFARIEPINASSHCVVNALPRPETTRAGPLAGIALAREAQLATRNLRHFDDTTISLINPFGG